jgi:predicted thioesterase
VEPAHAIDFAEGGMPAIHCTPWLVWYLEHAARDAVVPFLGEGESTVGSHIDIDHLAATPVGHSVNCLARVVHVEGRQVSFQLVARDESEVIARVPPPSCHRRGPVGPAGGLEETALQMIPAFSPGPRTTVLRSFRSPGLLGRSERSETGTPNTHRLRFGDRSRIGQTLRGSEVHRSPR